MKTLSNLLAALLLPLMVSSGAAHAELEVVATTSSMAALVREVAPDRTKVTLLVPPDRDAHHLQARPSMIRALRGADLVVAVGAELEVGWLPLAIGQSANPAILPGRAGYFEAAAQVPLLDVNQSADRAKGDVHPAGNPHVTLDPVRMATIARALAARLAELDPAQAEQYRARADAFADRVERRVTQWRARMAGAPGVVLFHRDAIYLLDRFAVPLLGTVEPVPGVPPGGAHLRELITTLRGGQGVVVRAPYHPEAPARQVADTLGWSLATLSLEPPLASDGAAYLNHIEQWVTALAGAADG